MDNSGTQATFHFRSLCPTKAGNFTSSQVVRYTPGHWLLKILASWSVLTSFHFEILPCFQAIWTTVQWYKLKWIYLFILYNLLRRGCEKICIVHKNVYKINQMVRCFGSDSSGSWFAKLFCICSFALFSLQRNRVLFKVGTSMFLR